jgi:RNA polymerase sigma factor for flagellar operon FliA
MDVEKSDDQFELRKKALAREIDSLPENQRLVMSLYYHEELSIEEIGKVLRISHGEVNLALKSALMRLQVALGELFGSRK